MSRPSPIVRITIVDVAGTRHARLMEQACATSARLEIRWLAPDHELPDRLLDLTDQHAVALPLSVRGGSSGDDFVVELRRSIATLKSHATPVFVPNVRQAAHLSPPAIRAVLPDSAEPPGRHWSPSEITALVASQTAVRAACAPAVPATTPKR